EVERLREDGDGDGGRSRRRALGLCARRRPADDDERGEQDRCETGLHQKRKSWRVSAARRYRLKAVSLSPRRTLRSACAVQAAAQWLPDESCSNAASAAASACSDSSSFPCSSSARPRTSWAFPCSSRKSTLPSRRL